MAFSFLHEETGLTSIWKEDHQNFEKESGRYFLWNKEQTRKERLWYGRSSRRDVLREYFFEEGDTSYKRRLTGYIRGEKHGSKGKRNEGRQTKKT